MTCWFGDHASWTAGRIPTTRIPYPKGQIFIGHGDQLIFACRILLSFSKLLKVKSVELIRVWVEFFFCMNGTGRDGDDRARRNRHTVGNVCLSPRRRLSHWEVIKSGRVLGDCFLTCFSKNWITTSMKTAKKSPKKKPQKRQKTATWNPLMIGYWFLDYCLLIAEVLRRGRLWELHPAACRLRIQTHFKLRASDLRLPCLPASGLEIELVVGFNHVMTDVPHVNVVNRRRPRSDHLSGCTVT